MRKKKEPKEKRPKNVKKILKWVAIVCAVVIVLELFYLMFVYFKNESKNTYFDGLNAIDKIEDGYIAVGSSDFKRSKGNSWTEGYEKGKLVLYDEDYQLLWEKKYDKGYNTTFFDVDATSDGYIAVGSGEMSQEQNDNQLRDALIVKYDKDGNIVFEKQFQVLGNAKFTKVKAVDDGFYVIGQSIFPPMDLGFADNGGGVLVKYDQEGNEVFRSNFGGSKSGLFNDFVISDDGIYVVGKDAANTGLLVKYSMDGERLWIKNYSYTDSLGFSSIVEHNDQLVVVGATKVKDDDSDYDTDGLLLKYDKDGKLLMDEKFTVNERVEEDNKAIETSVSMDRFNAVVIDEDDNIVIAGQVAVKDEEESDSQRNVFRYNGLFMKYSWDGELLEHREIGGSRDDYFTGIRLEEDHYLITGYANSKDQDLKRTNRNGKDFKPLFLEINEDGNIEKIK